MLALEGIRVLECAQVMAGPYCGMILADLGAEVVKVEPPAGDDTRRWGPFVGGESMAFMAVNRGKKSITLNLKSPQGAAALRRLAAGADVLIENNRPGTMANLGLAYEDLRQINPRLVYCSISGYGQTGPYAEHGGYDLIAQGATGLMSITGEVGGPPVKVGVPITDLGTALFALIGILGALWARQHTGEGQHVDASLYDTGVALGVWEAHSYFASGQVPGPLGSAHRLLAPYQALRARDGSFTVGAGAQGLWERFARLLGLEQLLADPRFQDPPSRLQHRVELQALLEEVTATQPRSYWLDRLTAAGIPCGPIARYDEVLADPHTLARGLVTEVVHPTAGSVRTLGPAVKMSGTPARVGTAAPLLGQHTEAVLAGAGWSEAEVADLRAAGALS